MEKSRYLVLKKIIGMCQGNNARKVISEVYAFFVLQSLGGKVNTRRMSQPDMESILTKIIY